MELCWSEEDFRQKFGWAFEADYPIIESDIPDIFPCICYYWVSESGNCGCIEDVPFDQFIDKTMIDYINSKAI